MDALLGIIAATAATVLAFRQVRSFRAARRMPGASAARPLPVADFGEIDATVAVQRCVCGGRFRLRGEGPVGATPALRRAATECVECGRERALYFDLSGILH